VPADLVLEHLDARGGQEQTDDLVALYLEVYHEPVTSFHGEERYRRQLAGHLTAPRWEAVTARYADVLIGYVYGFTLPAETRWWRGLLSEVMDGFTVENGQRTFAISELLVRKQFRRRGVATSLHAELLANRTEERATLLVEPDNVSAQAAYAAWGWRKEAILRPSWEHAPLYDVLMLPLPVVVAIPRPRPPADSVRDRYLGTSSSSAE
jgi:GNAT superfamily N-acetyltransferase